MYLFIVYMIEINWQTNITGNKDWPFLHVTVILYKQACKYLKGLFITAKEEKLGNFTSNV